MRENVVRTTHCSDCGGRGRRVKYRWLVCGGSRWVGCEV